MSNLEKEIKEIKERNKKVELDKAWETSWARRFIVFGLTYFVVVVFFYSADLPNPWINSLVPALAYILSTATLPIFKKIWIKNVNN